MMHFKLDFRIIFIIISFFVVFWGDMLFVFSAKLKKCPCPNPALFLVTQTTHHPVYKAQISCVVYVSAGKSLKNNHSFYLLIIPFLTCSSVLCIHCTMLTTEVFVCLKFVCCSCFRFMFFFVCTVQSIQQRSSISIQLKRFV